MGDSIVVLATFSSEVEAQLVRNRLDQTGITTTLEGSSSTTAFAGMGGAFSTVKLMVHEEDYDRALEILNDEADEEVDEHSLPPELSEQGEEDEIEDEEDIIDPHNPEYLASRALRCSILSYLLFPFVIYSFWLIIKSQSQQKELSAKSQWKLTVALILNFGALWFTWVWFTWIRGGL